MSEEIKFGGTYLCSKCGMHHNSSGCPKDILMELAEVKSGDEGNVQPLDFTLTPDEVKIVKDALEIAEELAISILQAVCGDEVPIPSSARIELLNRIKQWQDENATNKGTESTSD